ncbi:peptidase, M23/M37 family [Aquipluma nitroreducens]|uniref:Peptidase, M23/M37 family n=2 Tax=Aquipluma nitroreducens TaxID=2010828 RepID=A0A5K7SA49_9BACT|nr:peptidase, M23/M37 family [Aquipluma nitroreducens]
MKKLPSLPVQIFELVLTQILKMKISIITLAVSVLFSLYSTAQEPIPATINPINETFQVDTLANDGEELEVDSLKLTNDETLYKSIWNSTQIKYPINTLPNKNDTITISLLNSGDSPFVMPVKGQILSKFGPRHRRMHTGTDIRLNSGDTVRCAFDGRVRLAKVFRGYGNLVLVRHNNGLETIYAHLKAIKVKVNDTVKAGDLIGLGGRTGRATCNHLHFETRLFGEPFDSNKYIDYETFALRSDKVIYKNKQFVTDLKDLRDKPAPENKLLLASGRSGASKHVIRKGDNLWVIAKKYNTTVKKLCAVNKITASKTLKVGSVLRIN